MMFPLPIVAFEDYMLADDRPAYPMNFFIRMSFSGRVDESAAREALRDVAARHPLMTAQICDRGRRRARWVRTAERQIPLYSLTSEDPAAFPACSGLDIETGPGMAGYKISCGAADQMLWQFHHACCDGLGAFQLLEDWLISYARYAGDTMREGVGRKLEESRLAGRGRFGLSLWQLVKKSRKQAVGLLGIRKFLMRRPVPLVADQAAIVEESSGFAYPVAKTHMFTREQTRALRTVAKRRECTVNDLLARDLFLALGRFRQRHSLGESDDWLRLSVPMNLRRAADRSLPAANVVSLVFLDRQSADFGDPLALLRSVRDEMLLIKTHELGLTFVLSLAVARRLPGGLGRQRDRYRCTATALLTNLGNLFTRTPVRRDGESRLVVGGLTLESLDLVAPIRQFTGAAFSLFHYAHCQGITMQYDPRMLTAEWATELLEDYVQSVRESAGMGDGRQ